MENPLYLQNCRSCHGATGMPSGENKEKYPKIKALNDSAFIAGLSELTPLEFEGLIMELRLKGERLFDALSHPGHGRRDRHVIGERDLEGR